MIYASDFDFALPPSLIAQQPTERRDAARLFVLPRAGGETRHLGVGDLVNLLPERALLIVNDTRVIPARLHGRKPTGGRVELVLLRPLTAMHEGATWRETWTCVAGASKPIRPGLTIALDGERAPMATVMATRGIEADVQFVGQDPGGLVAAVERIGEVPLPPYIERGAGPSSADDRGRYQTVYARVPGAAAAPTAGLHFTDELLERLAARGVERASVTLHVGLGTFAPLRSDEVDPRMELHAERYTVPPATSDAIARARAEGRPVIAVGTTTVRTLESAADDHGAIRPGDGETRLFITPGYRFRALRPGAGDGLITNFHLPKSTLLMLVSAFVEGGKERVLAAYAEAVARGYRFFSYGDAMLIQ